MADDTIINKQALADKEQPQMSDEETEGACKIVPSFEISFERCFMCGLEHDSPEFGPYCALCHDFLYPNALLVRDRPNQPVESASTLQTSSSQLATSNSGVIAGFPSGVGLESEDSGCESEKESLFDKGSNSATCRGSSESKYKLPYLSLYERVRTPDLVAKRLANELNLVEEDLFETLPPESEFLFTLVILYLRSGSKLISLSV